MRRIAVEQKSEMAGLGTSTVKFISGTALTNHLSGLGLRRVHDSTEISHVEPSIYFREKPTS